MGLAGGGTEPPLGSSTVSLGSDSPLGSKEEEPGYGASCFLSWVSFHTLFLLLIVLLCLLSLKDSWNK